jgi:glycosyltransferase involved in cell wall biosynthesis
LKINWIGPYKPVPDRSGADLRSYHLLKELSRRGAKIYGHFLGSHGNLADEFLQESTVVERSGLKGYFHALSKRIQGMPLTVGRYRSPRIQRSLDFNRLTYVDHLHMTANLPSDLTVPYWLDDHNLEFRLWEQYAELFDGVRGFCLGKEAECVRTYEMNQIKNSKGTGLPTEITHDQSTPYNLPSPVLRITRTIPNGVSEEWLEYGKIRLDQPFDRPQNFGFIGEYDWFPNKRGIERFLERVWDDFAVAHSEATLHLAGNNPSTAWSTFPSVKLLGYVDSIEDFFNGIDVMIIPLEHGAGTRLKALEAAARGIPIISTKKGTEGLNLSNRFQAETIAGLSETMDEAINRPDTLRQTRETNYRRVEANHRWETIGETLWNRLNECAV